MFLFWCDTFLSLTISFESLHLAISSKNETNPHRLFCPQVSDPRGRCHKITDHCGAPAEGYFDGWRKGRLWAATGAESVRWWFTGSLLSASTLHHLAHTQQYDHHPQAQQHRICAHKNPQPSAESLRPTWRRVGFQSTAQRREVVVSGSGSVAWVVSALPACASRLFDPVSTAQC